MDEKGLGQLLQAARKRSGLTQQELCHRARLSYSTLAKIERGAIKAPSIFTVQTIAVSLGMSLDTLLGTQSLMQVPKTGTSKSGVRFVYFDINGCLVRFYHRAFARLSEQSGQSADLVEMTFWHYNDQVCRGAMSLEAFNKALAERLAMKSVDWREYYLEAIEPILEMREVVEWAAKHYQIGLLTNIMPGCVSAMQRDRILPDVRFDSIIDSSVVGAIKPEPAIYEQAVSKAGIEPGKILLIDDARTNLMAAEKLGWHVMWFDDSRPKESAARVFEALELAV